MACSLAGSLFDACDLRLTDFGAGNYRGCDLRGKDLSALTGVSHLNHIIIDQAETMQVWVAFATALEMTLGDDLKG